MPRIRNIKPEFWDSPDTARADLAVRLTYMAMWNWADDAGRGTANIKELEAFCFPNDDVRDLPRGSSGTSRGNSAPVWRNFAEILREVAEAYGVVFYTVKGRTYYIIPTFKEHQSKNFRENSRLPHPSEGQIVDIASGNVLNRELESRTVAEIPAHVAEIPAQGAEKGSLDRDKDRDWDKDWDKEEEGSYGRSKPYEAELVDVTPPKNLDIPDPPPGGAHGTPNQPRCDKHQHIPPGGYVPECRDCLAAKHYLTQHAPQPEEPQSWFTLGAQPPKGPF